MKSEYLQAEYIKNINIDVKSLLKETLSKVDEKISDILQSGTLLIDNNYCYIFYSNDNINNKLQVFCYKYNNLSNFLYSLKESVDYNKHLNYILCSIKKIVNLNKKYKVKNNVLTDDLNNIIYACNNAILDENINYNIIFSRAFSFVVYPTMNLNIKCNSIDYEAFDTCIAMSSINLYEVKNIVSSAFHGCENLISVNIDNTCQISSIPRYLFDECKSLKSISLNDNIKIINKGAFSQCFNLEYILLSGNVNELYLNAFDGCVSISSLTLSKNIETLHLMFDNVSLKEIQIQNNNIINLQYYDELKYDLSILVPENQFNNYIFQADKYDKNFKYHFYKF